MAGTRSGLVFITRAGERQRTRFDAVELAYRVIK